MENIVKKMKEELAKSVEHFENEIGTLSVGRATPLLIEDIMVDYYGTLTPIKQIASISIPDPRSILIMPWEKSLLKEIEKAINLAKLGFNPTNDGDKIRIAVPQPTEERRKDLVKHLNGLLEKGKVSIRNAREDAMKQIKKMEKDGLVSEDQRFRKQEEIQEMVNEYNNILEAGSGKKEKEIMTI